MFEPSFWASAAGIQLLSMNLKRQEMEDMRQHAVQAEEINIETYYRDVEYLARAISRRVPPGVPVDDLIAAGYLGLVDAVKKFDSRRQSSFRTYAVFRIRGAIFDELRKSDHVPRLVRSELRKLSNVVKSFVSLNGREPFNAEIAQIMNLKPDKVEELLSWKFVKHESFEGTDSKDSLACKGKNAFDSLEQEVSGIELGDLLALLEKREREIVTAVYLHERKMADVAQMYKVSESRVSQIVSKALMQLRKKIRNNIGSREASVKAVVS